MDRYFYKHKITKKQINVIYRLAKEKKLNVEKWQIKDFYDTVDFYGVDWGQRNSQREDIILKIVNCIFSDDIEKAQKEIDLDKKWTLELFTDKKLMSLDRSLV